MIRMNQLLLGCMIVVTTFSGADSTGGQHSAALTRQLEAALDAKGAGYEPRTRHVDEHGRPLYTNRLILEDSPYLLQHAHNPVDWFSWGPEAFERADRENKPVFLSIGYATCHWCHVMESESFEDEAVAGYLNAHFISIKVDRERRPDVDEIYMTAVQLIAGRGGWPMSSFLTPDGKTFYGGTYYPKRAFLHLLRQVDDAWRTNHAEIVSDADQIARAVQAVTNRSQGAGKVGADTVEIARRELMNRRDRVHGGLGGAPKFPQAASYLFLIDLAYRNNDAQLIEAIRFDLKAISQGGIYDQIGGGFHRYATDERWRVPHFEKMLYSQAQLALVYFEAWRLTGDSDFLRVSRQTLDFVLRDMRSTEGGFFSATDADSEGGEGRFFLWTPDQLDGALNRDDASLAKDLFGVSDDGNFEGSNILFLPVSLHQYVEQVNEPTDDFLARVDRIRERLYRARERRPHPIRDEKIITAWNAMMICALAAAADLSDGERYRTAALQVGELLWSRNRNEDGSLWRIRLDERSSISATLDDYAWLANAFVSLYDISRETRWLERAESIVATMNDRFRDPDNGGYFINTEDDNAPAMARPKIARDGAEPGGNAVALVALARLQHRPANGDHRDSANGLIAAFARAANQQPSAHGYLLRGLQILDSGETGSRQYAARGAVRVHASVTGKRITIMIGMEPGWHINAHQTLSPDLVPTTMSLPDSDGLWTLGDIAYPPAVRKTMAFREAPLALYEGRVELTAEISARAEQGEKAATKMVGGKQSLSIDLQLQACDQELCLPPETLTLQVSR